MPRHHPMSWADTIQKHWSRATPPAGLRALAGLYGMLTALRRRAYRHVWLPSERLPVPVVVVGNISVGGTGKTPLVIALVHALRARGFVPGVVSRGYGGSVREPCLLDAHSQPALVGDEPCLIRVGSDAPVAVGRDRVAAARLLLAQAVDVIISDDGLQHYRLQRDVEICVIDGLRRFGNGRLLPAGPLREPLTRLASVDFRVVNGGEPRADETAMRLLDGEAWRLAAPHERRPLTHWAGSTVHAVAGIGYPPRFFDSLRAHGMQVVEHAFPDHYAYVASDLIFAADMPILMTAKDAIKCRRWDLADAWVVPVEASLASAFLDAVAARLHAAATLAVNR